MKVELLSVFGDDLMVVNAARVSFGKQKDVLDDKDVKLIKFLADNQHSSPFRHPQLQFRIECPIFVERQLFKHQVGWTANSISGRYVSFQDNYYSIKHFRKQSKDNKQGSYGDLDIVDNMSAQDIYNKAIQTCKESYEALLKLGVSKEQARGILPLTLETKFIWTGSLQAFIHLCRLRLKNDSQQETRELVTEMYELLKKDGRFKHSLEAFGI